MACNRWRLAVERSVDSGFSALMLSELGRHAKSCESCARDLVAIRAVVTRLREDILVDPPTGFEPAVLARLSIPPAPRPRPAESGATAHQSPLVDALKLLAGIVLGALVGSAIVAAL